MRDKIKKGAKCVIIVFFAVVIIWLIVPTWTEKIDSSDGISELSKIQVNGTKINLMIRGNHVDNPILLFVHGGPANSEIPYVTKYQDLLEQSFIVVHYDQRESGKSYHFMEDYGDLCIQDHIEDLAAVTDYLRERFRKEKVILVGHSFGTYIATITASQYAEKYIAYIGIGQLADPLESELDSLNFCIQQAENKGNKKDYEYLQSIREEVESKKIITPRKYVRKYGGAALKIDDTRDLVNGLLFGTEYNLYDVLTYGIGALRSQKPLIKEEQENPLPQIVRELKLPFYFIMGEQDYMTSVSAASHYFTQISCEYEHEMIVYPDCAHFPHFEEKEKFYEWMHKTFGK